MDAALGRGTTSPAFKKLGLGERKSSFGKSPRGNHSAIKVAGSFEEENKEENNNVRSYLERIN
jgi:hypothetical protein